MLCRASRIVEEPQRDPSGVELGLDLHLARRGGMFGAELVGGFCVALIEQLARQQAPLDPPFIAVYQHDRVARRRLA